MLPADASLAARPDFAPARLALFTDTYAPQLNGVVRTLARLAAEVERRNGEVRVFTPADIGTRSEPGTERWPSLGFWAYPQLRVAAPAFSRAVRALRSWRPTIVHVATPFGVGLAGRYAARALGIPVVSSYHTSFAEYASYYGLGWLGEPGWRYLRWFHNGTRHTYCPTRAVADDLHARGFTEPRIWSRGVDASRFSPRHRSLELRRALGAGADDVMVLYVGRVAREKGLPRLLEQFVAARAVTPSLRLCIVGEGPFLEDCRAMAPADTQFLGRLEGHALAQAYASADIFAFPSTTDTFGNVLLEAMASGLPVAAVDSAPTCELVDPDHGIVAGRDVATLADALCLLAHDRTRRARLGGGGLVFARQCSWERIFDRLFLDYATAARESPVRDDGRPGLSLITRAG